MRRRAILIRGFLVAIVAAGAYFVAVPAVPATLGAATITVNSIADDTDGGDGDCTLREAIIASNTNTTSGTATNECAAGRGDDTIEFSIGTGTATISPGSPLPDITDPVTIDGFSQGCPDVIAGFRDPCIGLDGDTNSVFGDGLSLTSFSTPSIIEGLAIFGFSTEFFFHGIHVRTSFNTIRGNFIGLQLDGTTATFNGHGVFIDSGASSNLIGGSTSGAGNIISGNGGSGVSVVGSGTTDNSVRGNTIGLDSAGNAKGNVGNGVSIHRASSNLIGGSTSGAGNVISGNGASGVSLVDSGTTDNVVAGNTIGLDSAGNAKGNGRNGVSIQGASSNTIGGTTSSAGNTIAHNAADGVALFSTLTTGNTITYNSIHSNAGLGIDLGDDGVTANDPDGADGSPNRLQNYPVITSAIPTASGTTVSGTLDSTPSTTFRIEFFSNTTCDPSGHGEGEVFEGSVDVTTDGSGDATFTHAIAQHDVDTPITATATDTSTGDTSEFSACTEVRSSGGGGGGTHPADLSVEKTALQATATPGGTIDYEITVTNLGPGPAFHTELADDLPGELTGITVTDPGAFTCTVDDFEGTSSPDVVCDDYHPRSGDATTVAVRATVEPSTPDGTLLVNIATVASSLSPDPDETNNTATDETTVDDGSAPATCGGKDITIDQGTPGDDVIVGTEGDDVIHAGPGDDVVRGKGGDDTICLGGGNDIGNGGDGNDTIFGATGDDIIRGQGGNDAGVGGPGNDTLIGGPGDDTLRGQDGVDEIRGLGGNDTIAAGADDDVQLFGGAGEDVIRGQGGDDKLNGGNQDDELFGGPGNDKMLGAQGADFLRGHGGADDFNGGGGNDNCVDVNAAEGDQAVNCNP